MQNIILNKLLETRREKNNIEEASPDDIFLKMFYPVYVFNCLK